MNITQVCIGRFHHFHLARQIEKLGFLDAIYTGYPRFKLKDEQGIPPSKIKSFPWIQGPYMARAKLGLDGWSWLNREWAWQSHETLDRHVARQLKEPTILIGLSGSGLHSGARSQQLGGIHVCDRGSSHILTQQSLLNDEHLRYGNTFWNGIDSRSVDKELSEYEQADYITVPSKFCYDSFIDNGISPAKLLKIPYGARLERFYPEPPDNTLHEGFTVLFVGRAGVRKGFRDLLAAFQLLKHPHKKLVLIGSLSLEARSLIGSSNSENIHILGSLPNSSLRQEYSKASVFVLPSIEEGLAMVIGEAMACGCPVVASANTGAEEFITDSIEGFIVPIRSPHLIADRLQQLADSPQLRAIMSNAATCRVNQLGGWSAYGDAWRAAITRIKSPLNL